MVGSRTACGLAASFAIVGALMIVSVSAATAPTRTHNTIAAAGDCVLIVAKPRDGEPGDNFTVPCDDAETQWSCPDTWQVTEAHTECGTVAHTQECNLHGSSYHVLECPGACAPNWDPDLEKRCTYVWDEEQCEVKFTFKNATYGSSQGC